MGINVKDLDDITSVEAGDKILTIDTSDTSDSADGTLKLSTVSQVGSGGAGDMTAATYDPTGVEADAFDVDNHASGSTNKVYTATEQSKLAAIEASADVTDATNVAAAGALMDSEVDADLKTLSLPANTTISTFGASLVDDADASTALSTIGAAASSHTHVEADITDLGTYLEDITGESLGDLSDVVVTTVANNEVLAYDTGGNWINQTASEAGLAEAGHTHTESEITDLGSYADASHTHVETDITDLGTYLEDITGENLTDLGDVVITTPADNEVLAWNGTDTWINQTPTEAGLAEASHSHTESDITDLGTYLEDITGESIGDLSDVTITTGAQGDILYNNGTAYVNLGPGTDGYFLKTQGAAANPVWAAIPGGGDMLAATYDPTSISASAFDVDNHVSGDTNKVYTATEQSKLSGIEESADVTDATNVAAAGAVMDADFTTDGGVLVGTGAGTFAEETGATLLTSLGVDAAGTDNSTDVTLAGTPDYITITGQEITRGQIDLTTDVTGVLPEANLPNAGAAAEGVVELATSTEITAGSDAGRVVTPDALAESTIFGQKALQATVVDYTTDLSIGDGQFYFVVPQGLNGMNLVRVHGRVISAGTTGTTDIQIHNLTDTQDMLSTVLTIDSGETGSDTAATAAVINATYDDVATNDLLRIDVDAVSTTAPKGLILTMEFRLP